MRYLAVSHAIDRHDASTDLQFLQLGDNLAHALVDAIIKDLEFLTLDVASLDAKALEEGIEVVRRCWSGPS